MLKFGRGRSRILSITAGKFPREGPVNVSRADSADQITKARQQRVSKPLILFWSHPPESNRRPTDYESVGLLFRGVSLIHFEPIESRVWRMPSLFTYHPVSPPLGSRLGSVGVKIGVRIGVKASVGRQMNF